MAIITMPTNLLVAQQTFGVARFDLNETSAVTGHSADRLLAPPRWTLSLRAPQRADAAAIDLWRSMILKLRGRVNHLAAWDTLRPAPRGTMRGTLSLWNSIIQGATTATVNGGAGQAGKTLLAGDWLQFGTGLTSQLVCLVENATADVSGLANITFENPIRAIGGYTAGTTVTWDKPVGHYKRSDQNATLSTADGAMLEGNSALELMEQW